MKGYIVYMESVECLHHQRALQRETRNQIERGQKKKDKGLTLEQLAQVLVKVRKTKPLDTTPARSFFWNLVKRN